MEEELEDDQQLLADLLKLLQADARSELIAKTCTYTVATIAGPEEERRYRLSWPDGVPVEPTPEMLAGQFLERSMPTVPGTFFDESFDREYRDRASARLSGACRRVIFASCAMDNQHATEWASDLSECARDIAPSFMGLDAITDADDPEGLLVDVDDVASFIREWRRNFVLKLAAARRRDD